MYGVPFSLTEARSERAAIPVPQFRIFSYLPNPRVWKATIAGRIGGVDIEVVGDRPKALADWLWDFDARPLAEAERDPDGPHARTARRGFGATLYKTDAFLDAHPFGTVPAAFDSTGSVGIFESNSILRAVARAGDADLYGANDLEASRIDSFLDQSLVFAREAQVYLLALQARDVSSELLNRMRDAYDFYLAGIDAATTQAPAGLVGGRLSVADIAFVCDLAQFRRERRFHDWLKEQGLRPIVQPDAYPNALAHFRLLLAEPAIAADLADYENGAGS